MLLGVVSDTHNNLANVAKIVEIFNRSGVDRVVHTGDITQAKVLEVLARLDAPLCGVFGNNDLERTDLDAACRRFGFDFDDGARPFEWGSRRVLVVHDPLHLPQGEHDLVLHGHNHRTVIDRSPGRLVFNPGECAGHLNGHNRVGVIDLSSLALHLEHF